MVDSEKSAIIPAMC